jgi:hypothetical protein
MEWVKPSYLIHGKCWATLGVLAGIHAAHQGVTGMTGRIDETVFWPGVTTDIIRTRSGCMTCVREAPSQPAGFPTAPPSPAYPFQMICADDFSLQGHNFLVVADLFTGWQQVYPAPPGKFDGRHFINFLREFFATWNIAEHHTTDGGQQMWLNKLDVQCTPPTQLCLLSSCKQQS